MAATQPWLGKKKNGSPWLPDWMPGNHQSGNWQDWYTNNPYATGASAAAGNDPSQPHPFRYGTGSDPNKCKLCGQPPNAPIHSAEAQPGGEGGLFGENQGAFDTMMLLLEQYGLGSLAGVLQGLILDGITDQASLMLALQQTQEWKDRFAGNEMLAQNGVPVLSVAEYLAVERSYAQILKNHGLPAGFYDDPADFAKWIGNSVSANELNQRATMYSDLAKREDPAIIEQLKSMGLSEGDILAHLMDPSRAMPLLQKKYQTTLIGAAARRQGVVGDNEYLGHLSDIGVTEQQAIQGYGVIGENLSTLDTLGDIHGEDYDQRDFESEVFEQDGQSAKKRKKLASRERAAFSGESGIGQGSLTRRTGGSY